MNVTRAAVARRTAPGETMSFADYSASPGVNFSTLRFMAESPLHYLHALENPPPETSAMLLGRATHTAVFEPRRFQIEYAVWEGDRRGNAYRDFYEACEAQRRSVLRESEYSAALAIRDAVRGIPEIASLLEKGRPEISLFWRNPVSSETANLSSQDQARPGEQDLPDPGGYVYLRGHGLCLLSGFIAR